MEWISANKAGLMVSGRDHPRYGARPIFRRARAALVCSRAKKLTINDKEVPPDDSGYVAIDPKFWWAEGGAALDQDWRAGDFGTWLKDESEYWKAYGVEFELNGITDIYVNEKNTTRKGEHVPAMRAATLNAEYQERMPGYVTQRGNAKWWNWPECVAWVRTRDINEVAARQAWRDFLVSQGNTPDGYMLVALMGVGDEQANAKASLVAALMAEEIDAKDAKDRRIPSHCWSTHKTAYSDELDLLPVSDGGEVYLGVWLRREDVQRVFSSIAHGGEAAAIGSAHFEEAAIHPRWQNDHRRDFIPFVHEMACMVQTTEGLGLHRAAYKIAGKVGPDLRMSRNEKKRGDKDIAIYLYQLARQIYDDNTGLPLHRSA